MSKKTYFKVNGTGSEALPITGGTDEFQALNLDEKYERVYFSIVFYTDATLSTLATPTTGTVTFSGKDGDATVAIDSGEFNAADTYLATTLQPAATGNFTGATLELSGVDSGLYARAWAMQKGADQ